MRRHSCVTSGSGDAAAKGLSPVMERILEKLRENEAAGADIRECPAPCADRTVEVVTKSGVAIRAVCPIASPGCAYGLLASQQLEARLGAAMTGIGIPWRYLSASNTCGSIAAVKAAEWKRSGFLVFYGKPGSGKSTGAARAVRDYIRNAIPDALDRSTWERADRAAASVLWYAAMELSLDKEALANAMSASLLVIDDLGGEDGARSGAAAIRHVISTRYGWGKPTIITTALALDAIGKRYGNETVRRIADAGLIVDCGEALSKANEH